jgi:hypothetical protein
MNQRFLRVLVVPAAAVTLFLGGCNKAEKVDLAPQVASLTAELEAAKAKLAAAEKELAVKNDKLALAPAAADSTKAATAEKDKVIAKKDEEIAKLQGEVNNLKKSDGNTFAEIRAVQASGLVSSALGRYQQFVLDFPESPLIPNAKLAIAELTSVVSKRADEIDPGHREREVKKRFTEGVVTVDEVAPVLKGKTAADVIKYLGRPTKTLRNGAELAYADKGINSGSGDRGMLIIRFEEGLVAGVRVDYQGREVKP